MCNFGQNYYEMRDHAYINHFSPYLKLASLVIIILVTLLFTMLLGILLAVPFYGSGILENLSSYTDPAVAGNIALLKYFQIVSQLGLFIFPVIIFVYLVNINISGYLELRKAPTLFILIVSGVIMFVGLPVINWMVELNEALSLPESLSWLEQWMKDKENTALELTEAFLGTTTFAGLSINIIMMAIIPAIGEEFLFRGVLVRLFKEWFGNVHIAIIFSAVLFSALHLQFFGFFPRMVLGILFGYLFVWTNSLWVPIFAHFLNNAAAVIVAFLASTDIIKTDYESFGATSNSTFVIFSFIVTIVLLAFIYFHEKSRNTQSL